MTLQASQTDKVELEFKSIQSYLKEERKSYLNIMSQFMGRYGISTHARAMAESLLCRVSGVLGNNKLLSITQNIKQQHFGDLNSTLLAMYSEEPENTKASLQFWYPNTYTKFKGVFNIGYYIFEYNIIPRLYVEHINKMDAVCTASEWGKKVLEENGIKVPIIVFPVGSLFKNRRIDCNWKCENNDRYDLSFDRGGIFKFYHVGKFEERKGTKLLIQAFNEFSKGDNGIQLHLHIANPHSMLSPRDYLDSVAGDLNYEHDNIILHDETYEPIKINEYNCGVFPSLAEGVGLPIVEAMTTGMPVITCFNSGITQYANRYNCYLIDDLEIVPVYDPNFFPIEGEYGTWEKPSIESIVKKMEEVYSDLSNPEQSREKIMEISVNAFDSFTDKWREYSSNFIKELENYVG